MQPFPAPPGSPPGADVEELLALAQRLAVAAGDLVRRGRAAGRPAAGTKSTATDMVTEYDRAAEQAIAEGLREARPHDAILGEEGTTEDATTAASSPADDRTPITWMVDPIDGTTNFLYGLPLYTVSLAAADVHGSLAGVVVVPATGEVFAAARGRGATLDGEPIGVRPDATLATALVGTGFAYAPERRHAQLAMWARAIRSIRDLRRLGSAALDLCCVACGRYDAYAEHGLNVWDLAAGALVAHEAGARLGAIEGGPPRATSVLAASPAVFEPLQQLLTAAGAAAVSALYPG